MIEATRQQLEYLATIRDSLPPLARDEFDYAAQINLLRQMQAVGMGEYPELTGPPDAFRASGDCVCKTCGKEYWDHPSDWRVIGYGNVPFLTVLCDGTRVKL